MPGKGLIINGQRYAAVDATDDDDNLNGGKPVFRQLGLRPTSALRRNNPHPKADFLLPKNLVEMDEKQKLETHIQNSVRDYLNKIYQNGHPTNPQLAEIIRKTLGQGDPQPLPETNTPALAMGESEMMDNYVNPTEDALEKIMAGDKQLLKREQGNSYKNAGKVYQEIADAKEQLELERKSPQHQIPVFTRVSRKPQLGSDLHKAHWFHWPKAKPPTPGKQGLRENSATRYQVKYSQSDHAGLGTSRPASGPTTKRLHTPPTPPDRSRRVKSAAHETQDQVQGMRRSQSLPPSAGSIRSASSLLEKGDLQGGGEATTRESLNQRPKTNPDFDSLSIADGNQQERPKTGGPQLAKSMVVHPRMKEWIDSATDYEKEVAFSMLRTLSGRKTTDEEFNELEAKLNCTPPKPRPSANGSKPRKTWAYSVTKPMIPPATHTFDAYVPPSPAPVKSVPNRKGKEDKTTLAWMKKVEQTINNRMTPPEHIRSTVPVLPGATRPHARQKLRPRILGDYRHENSFFTYTNRSATGQFVIAPDWVSERIKQRRPKKPSDSQLRYGSK